jgi:general secretion pathway protein N
MMLRWAIAGVTLGAALAVVVFAPAAWLASAVSDATSQRVRLADARGTVWQGSAVMMLTGGLDSRDASALPDRLHWTLGLDGAALGLRARQACCINGELFLRVVPGWSSMKLELPARPATAGQTAAAIGQWPASWLVGLGTPWNTLQPAGVLQLSSNGLVAEQVQGRWRFSGQAVLALDGMSSRISTLATLGSYTLSLNANADSGDAARLQLATTRGALQLTGDGQILQVGSSTKLRFNGQASAAPGSETALGGLLNVIGRRQGALSVFSIG